MKQIICLFYLCFMCILLDAQSFKMKLTEHSFNVESVAYSLDGKLLASGSADGVIHVYELDSFGIPKIKQTFNQILCLFKKIVKVQKIESDKILHRKKNSFLCP